MNNLVIYPFVVRTSKEKMPFSCFGKNNYKRIAVIETVNGEVPSMISNRARGVIKIKHEWRRCHCGGSNSATAKALAHAIVLAHILNSEVWGVEI
jgi:hypothetical protein